MRTRQKPFPVRALFLLLKCLAGALLLCLLALAAGLVWLRTPSAAAFLADTAVSALQSQGLTLRMGGFSGPLPGRLLITDIALDDAKGPLLRAGRLELNVNLSGLLRGRLDIRQIILDAPELIRLPELPPSPPDETPSGDIPLLPVDIVLGKLNIAHGTIHSAALLPETPAEAPPVLSFAADASALLSGASLSAALQSSLLYADDMGLELNLELNSNLAALAGLAGPASARTGGDSLRLALNFREGEHGLAALLSGRTDLPAFKISLKGEGPVSDWQGDLLFKAGEKKHDEQGQGGLLSSKSRLSLRCENGSFWGDLILRPAFSLGLDSQVLPGADLPASFLPLLGQAANLDLQLHGADRNFKAEAELRSPLLQGKLSKVEFGQAKTGSRKLNAGIRLLLPDLPALASVFAAQQEQPPQTLPKSLDLEASLEAMLAGKSSGLGLNGIVRTEAGNEIYLLDLSLAMLQNGQSLWLERLDLQGIGLRAHLEANALMPQMALKAKLSVQAEDRARWQQLLAHLAGHETEAESPLGGELRLDASLDFPGLPPSSGAAAGKVPAAGTAQGSLRLQGTNMRWPASVPAEALGPSVQLAARLSGGDGQPYALTLEECRAGIFSAQGSASLAPGSGADPVEEILSGALKADITASVSDLALLAPPAPPVEAGGEGLSGSLTARLLASGPLSEPHIALTLDSPALGLAPGTLRDLALRLDARSHKAGDALSIQGELALAVADSPGGPLTLNSDWQAELPGGQNPAPLTAAVNNLKVRGAGLALGADLSATLAPGGAYPALKGALNAQISDWKKLAALAGAPLDGEAARMDVTLGHVNGRQSAQLRLDLPFFRLREEGGASSVFLRDLSAQASLNDMFGAPDIDVKLGTGRGKAAFLSWNKGSASVKGSSGRGDFSLTLRQEFKRRGRAATNAGGKGDPAERLALRGAYTFSTPEIRLDAFALRNPRAKAGLTLQKPLSVTLADGVSVSGLDAAFEPAGRLNADAAFSPEGMKVTLKLAALPFAFFKLFTSATLPDGELNAEANFSGSGKAAPRGDFSVQTRISATQSASGLKKADTQAASGQRSSTSPAAASAPFELSLSGKLDATPGPQVLPASGVRALPGVIWLRGNGNFGSAARQADSKAGRLGFQLPLRLAENGLPAPDADLPLAAAVYWNGPVENLWQAVPLPDRYLSGNALLDISLTGSLKAPKNSVKAYLAGVRFEDVANGLLISGINLEARNTEKGDVRALLSARDSQSGSLALEAELSGLDSGQGALKLRGQLDAFRPLHRDDLGISLSGIFGAKGPLNALEISSNIAVDHGELLLSSQLGGGSAPTLDTVNKRTLEEQAELGADADDSPAPAGPSLDLHIAIPRHFFIRGMGLDSEWQGDLRISGRAFAPDIKGALRPVRGYLDIFSRTFSLTGGDISFGGGPVINPLLNLELTFQGPDLTAFIRASGTAKKPKLGLDSRPPLPQDEVLAHVLFGKRTTDLSRFEAIQLADNMRQLTGAGGSALDLMSNVRKDLGLDMLRLSGTQGADKRSSSGQSGESDLGAPGNGGDSADAGLPALEAGKYINDSIYIGVEQGMDQDSTAVRVEVELFPSVTLQGKSSSEASEIGVGWKMDY